ncbi:SOS response-associated peptidase [bacterium]|nr:SOS response-associated peptidase [bacterium]
MCGRFIFFEVDKIPDRFDAIVEKTFNFSPNYNISPGQDVPIIIKEEKFNKVKLMRWGLTPFWVKNLKEFKPFINIRKESFLTKPHFYRYLKNRRCLIPSNGFYEWKKEEKTKTPYLITLKDMEIFSFAGIFDIYKDEENEIMSFAIITTEPNNKIKKIHDRMPVILDKEREKMWLDYEYKDYDNLIKFLTPYPDDLLDVYEVSTLVNNPESNYKELILPYKKDKNNLF